MFVLFQDAKKDYTDDKGHGKEAMAINDMEGEKLVRHARVLRTS